MRLLLLATFASLLLIQPAHACGNAMEGGWVNGDQMLLIASSLTAIMFFTALYLRSQSKLRSAEARERFKSLDEE